MREPADSSQPSASFRGDIDGLRAVAILLILAYHVALPGFSGGFVGVDVFFVISGWLITRNLLVEAETQGRIELMRFWAKRIRRLVPALATVLVGTFIASAMLLPRVEIAKTAEEGAAAALYVSNIFFRRSSEGYFGADVSRSPFLHTWSLGVEEQFYVVWPLLCAALLLVRRRGSARLLFARAFSALLVLSFAWNLSLTFAGGPRAFYALSARAWEFASAGLLAALPVTRPFGRRAASAAALSGVLLLISSAFAFAHRTPYPGIAALAPVSGTLLLIAAGSRAVGAGEMPRVSSLLASEPMQWLGRTSYSIYLWHWPFIVLATEKFGADTPHARAAAALASLPVAHIAYRYVENPIRFASSLVQSTRRTFALGGAATLGTLAAIGGVTAAIEWRPPSDIDEELKHAGDILKMDSPMRKSSRGLEYGIGGEPNSRDVVLLVGDSHAGIWFSAVSETAKEMGLSAALHAASGCPFIRVPVRMEPENPLTQEACRQLRAQGEALMGELHPIAVILTEWAGYTGLIEDANGNVPDRATQAQVWKSAYGAFLDGLRRSGIRTGVILDNPTLSGSPLGCIARRQSFSACAEPREDTLERTRVLQTVELEVLKALPDVPTLSPTKLLCNATRCNVALGGHLAYMDNHHLTYRATEEMKVELRRMLRTLVRK